MGILTQLSIVLTAAAITSSSVVKAPSINQDGTFELLILHNNDMHARFEQTSQFSGICTTADRELGKCYGGFPRVAHVVKEARRAAAAGEGPPVLYLNAGDTYTGTPWFNIYKWQIAAEFINALQPDAVSLGNHEFDNGVSGLTPFIENLICPVLASNLILNRVPSLSAETNLKKSVVFNISGTLVGVIGYLTPDTKFLAIKNDVDYIEEVKAVREEAVNLKKTGVKILIALGHSGFATDLKIAKDVEDIDLVIGGHTNTFLWNGASPDVEKPEGPYPTLVKQASGRLVPAVQAYAYTKYIGKLHLSFDLSGEITHFDGRPTLLDNSILQDPDVSVIVDKYRTGVMTITELTVGFTSVNLDGQSCRKVECNLGNLITDAIINKYASEYRGTYWTDSPIAIIQGGGIRSSVPRTDLPTKVTKGDLLTVMPYDGSLAKVRINGSDVINMLEHSVEKYNPSYPPGRFLQFSGLNVVYDFKMPPGKRVIEVRTRCGMCEIPSFSRLNTSMEYNILMPAFLAMGGDGFSLFSYLPTTALDYNELDSTVEYFQRHSPVLSGLDNRIIILNKNELKLKTNSASSRMLLLNSVTLEILLFVITYM